MLTVLRLRNLALGHKTYNGLSIILDKLLKLQAAFHYTHLFFSQKGSTCCKRRPKPDTLQS